MKLLYLHNTEITSDSANIVQVVSMCGAFSSIGVDVELALSLINERIHNPYEYLS